MTYQVNEPAQTRLLTPVSRPKYVSNVNDPSDGILLRVGIGLGFIAFVISQIVGGSPRYSFAIFVIVTVVVMVFGFIALAIAFHFSSNRRGPNLNVKVTCPHCGFAFEASASFAEAKQVEKGSATDYATRL
jgi:hypothetical protein